ncbi:MAG: murein biosynthesis integral membrane protein MurJ [Patescibacteria group bacterium]|nr:murein biosynthesis integral membrane protein MurJ [Patescibacteria group bacterium]
MIKKFLNNKSKTIASAAIILGAASLVSRLLGLVRDRILAGKFGAGDELDIYYTAFRIPDLVYSILVLGAITAGFIPVFINYLQKDKNNAWYLANSILNLIGLSLIVICLILIVFAPWLIKLIAPGFSPEKLSATVELARVMFLSSFFLGISTVLGGILRSFKRFLVYSLGPIMYNLGIIFGALFLIEPYGLLGLAYGVVLGSFFHMAIQVPTSFFCGFRWAPIFDFRFEGVKRIFKLMPPRVLNLILFQIDFLAMTIIASFLAVGSIAVYNLAHNIWSFPLGIFGISFVLAVFPKLSESAQKRDTQRFIKEFSLVARQILFFTLPSAALVIVLRAEIVQVILGTGNFDVYDVSLTLKTLAYFSIALFAEALILLLLRGFFAWEDAWRPFVIGLFATTIRVSSALFLSRFMGVPGLALGFSLGGIFYMILLFVFLKRKIGFIDGKKIFISGIKMVLASLLAGLGAYISLQFLIALVNINVVLNALIQGALAGLVGILIYLFFSWIFKLSELKFFLNSLFKK